MAGIIGNLTYMMIPAPNVAGSFDTRKKVQPGYEAESFYHGLVLGLIVTENGYTVTSNRESGLGRYDVIMKPREREGRESHTPAIIIEFKEFDPKKEKSLEGTAARALKQINERKYDADLIHEGISSDRIVHYGMAFRGKEALVKMEQSQVVSS